MSKLLRNVIIIIIRNVKIITSKLLQNVKTITKCQNVTKRQNYYIVKIIANIIIIAKHVKCQNYHENKHKFIYIKLNILNFNTSGVTKLQFIELYISYFLLECNIPPNADHLLSIIILNSLPFIIPSKSFQSFIRIHYR